MQNVRRSAICSTLLPLVFKLSTGAFFCIYFVPCFGRSDCWCGYCVAFVCTPVMQLGVWKWGGGTRKTGFTGGVSRAQYMRVWQGVRELPFPQKKWIWDWWRCNFPAVLRGSLAIFSLFLVDILSRSQFLPTHPLFLCETHIFKKWRGFTDIDWLTLTTPVVSLLCSYVSAYFCLTIINLNCQTLVEYW